MKLNYYIKERVSNEKELRNALNDRDAEFYFEVANLIFEARMHAGMTQEELANAIGTHQPAIARIEKGQSLPSLSFLQKIAKALKTYLIAPKFGFMEEINSNTGNCTFYWVTPL